MTWGGSAGRRRRTQRSGRLREPPRHPAEVGLISPGGTPQQIPSSRRRTRSGSRSGTTAPTGSHGRSTNDLLRLTPEGTTTQADRLLQRGERRASKDRDGPDNTLWVTLDDPGEGRPRHRRRAPRSAGRRRRDDARQEAEEEAEDVEAQGEGEVQVQLPERRRDVRVQAEEAEERWRRQAAGAGGEVQALQLAEDVQAEARQVHVLGPRGRRGRRRPRSAQAQVQGRRAVTDRGRGRMCPCAALRLAPASGGRCRQIARTRPDPLLARSTISRYTF